MENEKYLFVVSGAAGTGKDSVVSALRKAHPEIEKTVSATTRSPRPGEQEGVDYYYRTKEQFQQLIDQDEVVEHNFFNGNYYGTLNIGHFCLKITFIMDQSGIIQCPDRFRCTFEITAEG